MKRIACLAVLVLLSPAAAMPRSGSVARFGRGWRENRSGWVFVHLEGQPYERGYQYGYLLAPEIDDNIRMLRQHLPRISGKDWRFYCTTARRLFWPKVDREYQEELTGIADGLKARGLAYESTDILALNGWIDLAWYYVPWQQWRAKHKAMLSNMPRDSCSAFIATGSYTADHRIVMAHNCWLDYAIGERWNVIADIQPSSGHRILMDTAPGLIHSGDDFAENDAGILITETTIDSFYGFDPRGIPEFVRARKAAQYASSIDDFVRIMVTHNNGGYANDWLVGDTKTDEIARLELGLKLHPVTRTRDGALVGSNFPCDPKFIKEETNNDPKDFQSSCNARHIRWDRLMEMDRGKITADVAKKLLADHFDQANLASGASVRTLCGHIDVDAHGIPGTWGPYYPGGAVQAKVTTSALAGRMRMWAHMGHPCGEDFMATPFLKAHPEYRWQSAYLRDMRASPWTVFSSPGK